MSLFPSHGNTALSWEWHDISAACWRSLFADRRTGAYYFGRCDARLAHHIKRRRGDKFYGLGEKSGCLERGGRRFRMDCVDAMGYDAERSDPLYKFWPFYIAKPAPPATAAGLRRPRRQHTVCSMTIRPIVPSTSVAPLTTTMGCSRRTRRRAAILTIPSSSAERPRGYAPLRVAYRRPLLAADMVPRLLGQHHELHGRAGRPKAHADVPRPFEGARHPVLVLPDVKRLHEHWHQALRLSLEQGEVSQCA